MTIEQILKLGEMGYTKEEIGRLEQPQSQKEQTEVQHQQEQIEVQTKPQQEQTNQQQEQIEVQTKPQQEQTVVQNQNEIFKALLTELGAIKGAIQNNNAATLTQPSPKQETTSSILASLLVPPVDNK